MRFGVLGPLVVEDAAGGAVDVGGRRQRSVLARLLIAGGDVVSVDRLLDDLWGGEPPPRAVGSLQAFVSNLRRVLEPDRPPRAAAAVLVSAPPGYALRTAGHEVDAERFAAVSDAGASALAAGRPAAALRHFDDALGLWRGDAYADFADEPWAAPEAARLGELRIVAREQRAAALLAAGSAAAVVGELDVLTRAEPLRETPARLHALALYRTGRQADALAALRGLRSRLADELGLDPGPAVQQLETQILAQAPDLDWTPPREAAPAVMTVPPPRTAGAGRAAGSGSTAPTASADEPLGRDVPLRLLATEADRVVAGDGPRVAVVAGEPGIGKTFLVEALARRLTAAGWRTAWGRCPEAEGVPALWPWHQVLAALLGTAADGPGTGRTAGGGADEPLHALVGAPEAPDVRPPGAPGPDAAEARFRQHDAVARRLAALAVEAPLLVVLDDLQWADAGSLHLLLDLVALRHRGRVLVVTTVRRGEVASALDDALGRLAAAGAVRVDLDGLTPDEAARMARAAGVTLPPADVGRLVERTAGNPLFLRETLRLAARDGGARALESVAPTVQDLLRRRLARLPESTATLLASAAVLGRDVDPDLLLAVTAADEDAVLDALDGAAVAGVLVDCGAGRLRFAHDLLRETASVGLPPLRRARLHARAAEVLDRRSADPAAVAFHALAAGAGQLELAERRAADAAAAAGARYAYADAARWYSAAVEAARQRQADAARLVELRLALVRAQLDAGSWIEARLTRAEAVLDSDRTGDPELAARALVALDAPVIWTLHAYAEVDLDVVGRIERALETLPAGDGAVRCRLLGTLAAELYDGSDDPRCEALSAEAVAMARRLGDPRLLMTALAVRYQAIHLPRLAEENLALAGELVDLGRRYAAPATELLGHQIRAMFLLLRFRVREADTAAAACLPLLARLQLPSATAVHHMWLADRLLLDGLLPEARAAYRAAFAEQRQLGFFGTDVLEAVLLAYLAALEGRWSEVDEVVAPLASFTPYFAHTVRIWVAAGTGRVEEARALALVDDAPLLHDWAELGALAPRAEALIAAGSEAGARRCYAALLPSAGNLAAAGNAFCLGPVDYYLGRLAELFGDRAAAGRHLRSALEGCRREGLTAWQRRVTEALSVTTG